MEIMVFYVPCENNESAEELVKSLLRDNLIACGNVFKGQSMYSWEGEFCQEGEHIAIMKTTVSNEELVSKKIENIHSYDVPCIARWKITVNQAYGDWVAGEVRTAD